MVSPEVQVVASAGTLAGAAALGVPLARAVRAQFRDVLHVPVGILGAGGDVANNMYGKDLKDPQFVPLGAEWLWKLFARRADMLVATPLDDVPNVAERKRSRTKRVQGTRVNYFLAHNGRYSYEQTDKIYQGYRHIHQWVHQHRGRLRVCVAVGSAGFSGPSFVRTFTSLASSKTDLVAAFLYGEINQARTMTAAEMISFGRDLLAQANIVVLVTNKKGEFHNESHRLGHWALVGLPHDGTREDLEGASAGGGSFEDANKFTTDQFRGAYLCTLAELVEGERGWERVLHGIQVGATHMRWVRTVAVNDRSRPGRIAILLGNGNIMARIRKDLKSNPATEKILLFGREVAGAETVILQFLTKVTEGDLVGTPFAGFPLTSPGPWQEKEDLDDVDDGRLSFTPPKNMFV